MDDFQADYPRFPLIDTVHLNPTEKSNFIDLSPFMNQTPYTVRQSTTLSRVFRTFRTIGLRHMVVVDDVCNVVGMITRKNLAHFEELVRSDIANTQDFGDVGDGGDDEEKILLIPSNDDNGMGGGMGGGNGNDDKNTVINVDFVKDSINGSTSEHVEDDSFIDGNDNGKPDDEPPKKGNSVRGSPIIGRGRARGRAGRVRGGVGRGVAGNEIGGNGRGYGTINNS